MGFTDAWFDEHAPRLVRCQVTGYGSTGPKAAQPATISSCRPNPALMSICGTPDGVPTSMASRSSTSAPHAGL